MRSLRLETLLQYLKGFKTLYDVGTDHAYLPIEAIQRGYVERAIAVDNKQGPLTIANHHIEQANLSHAIETVHASGLEALTEPVDVVVIAGLGGKVIHEIMTAHPHHKVKRFVLQANTSPEKLRQLTAMNLKIIDEDIVEEDGIHYTVIVLENGTQHLSEQAIAFGPYLLSKKPLAYKYMLEKEQAYLRSLIASIPHDHAKKPHKKRLRALEEVLHDWTKD